jgi:hypothetical protein
MRPFLNWWLTIAYALIMLSPPLLVSVIERPENNYSRWWYLSIFVAAIYVTLLRYIQYNRK